MTITIRASSLPGYGDCARRWAARTLSKTLNDMGYGVKTDLPTSIGASIGTGVHAGAAFMLVEKMEKGKLRDDVQKDAEEFAITEYDQKVREGVIWDKQTENTNEAQQQVRRMVNVYRASIMPGIDPIAVERRLEADVGDGFMISGQSDLQTLQPGEIRDTKTGTALRTHYAQIGSYSLLARTAHKEFPVSKLYIDFIPRVTMKKPQPLPIVEEYDMVTAEQAAQATIDHIKIAVAEFNRRAKAGDSPPEHAFLANPSSMLCSPKYCPAHGSNFCHEHRKTL